MLVRVLVAFVAASGFLLGQLFFGDFSVAASMAGFGGLIAAVLLGMPFETNTRLQTFGLYAAIISVLGVFLDARAHYLYLNTPGNYYPWFLTVPFLGGLAILVGAAIRARRQSSDST